MHSSNSVLVSHIAQTQAVNKAKNIYTFPGNVDKRMKRKFNTYSLAHKIIIKYRYVRFMGKLTHFMSTPMIYIYINNTSGNREI